MKHKIKTVTYCYTQEIFSMSIVMTTVRQDNTHQMSLHFCVEWLKKIKLN